MATEQGIVIGVESAGPGTARVKTVQPSACKACASRDSCGTGPGKEREVDVINSVGAKCGDVIQITMETGALLKATFLLYVFPILFMLVGGAIGNLIGLQLSYDPSLVSAGVAIGMFILAMAFVRLRADKMALKTKYRPKITRIISRGPSPAAPHHIEPCSSQVAGNI